MGNLRSHVRRPTPAGADRDAARGPGGAAGYRVVGAKLAGGTAADPTPLLRALAQLLVRRAAEDLVLGPIRAPGSTRTGEARVPCRRRRGRTEPGRT